MLFIPHEKNDALQELKAGLPCISDDRLLVMIG